ncbi:Golgi-associated RAB2 interactor protein 5B [Moschus berezovskii]|uniref:Golgi-associated RAB2 interactor protein 5B n=1 Tax=Moschus berezovskii TaxID=68408 RepID=UPI00244461EC|nr:Golgi-associated RAB2 interactor protein 5B [Moschus berezovskii]
MNRLRNLRRPGRPRGRPQWVPTLGELQKTLQQGEHLPLRPLPMFESNFVQVTNRGAPVYVHHGTNRVTMGVAASLPGLVLPDMLLMAQPREDRECSDLVLTRMIPLGLAHLYVHDLSAWRLKLRLATGRYYYLELDAPDGEVGFLFDRWMRLISLLQHPATSWAPRTLHTPPTGLSHLAPPASTWRLQVPSHHRLSVTTAEPTFPYKILTAQRQKAKTLKRKFKSQAVGDSLPLVWSQLEHVDARKKSMEKKPQHNLPSGRPKTEVSEKPSITIRTIFSIISNTQDRMESSSKAVVYPGLGQRLRHSRRGGGSGPPGLSGEAPGPASGCLQRPDHRSLGVPHPQGCSETEGGTCLAGLLETPLHCISEESPEMPQLGACDDLDMCAWQLDVDNLMDLETSTVSTYSICPAACAPDFPSFNEKARPLPPTQKPPAVPAAPHKAPFILDQSKKVSAMPAPLQMSTVPGPSQKATAYPPAPQKAPFQKPPHVPTILQKAPAMPRPSQKPRHTPAIPQKAPAMVAPSQRAPGTLGVSLKAVSHPAPNRKSVFLPAPSQKGLTSPSQHHRTLGPDSISVPAQSHGGDVLGNRKPGEKPEPMKLMGTKEKNMVETRTQKTTVEVPFTTTEKTSEEVLIRRAQEIAVDGLKGKGKLEGRVHTMEEEIALDMPGFRSKEVGQQQTWVKTKKLAIQQAPQEQTRPFSVEGLTLAKLMIIAGSKDPTLRSALVDLPSWLSTWQGCDLSMMGRVPLIPTHSSMLEETLAGVQQPQLGVRVEEMPQDSKGPSNVSSRPRRAASSPKMNVASQTPIPLPSTRWEDIPESPTSLTPISKMEARVSQQPKRVSQEPERGPDQGPVATVGSNLEILLPTLLEMESMKDEASKVEKTKEELGAFTPSPSRPHSQQSQ